MVGAISFKALRRDATTTKLWPILESQIKSETFVLKAYIQCAKGSEHFSLNLPQKPCTESMRRLLLPRLHGELADMVAKAHFLDTLSSYSIHAQKTGQTLKIDIVRGRCAAKPNAVWCTRLTGGEKEYWLADERVDVGDFLKAFIHEKRMLLEGQMLEYSVDCRFDPVLDGWAEHGPRRLTFSKMMPK
jgi:hypothetical protein